MHTVDEAIAELNAIMGAYGQDADPEQARVTAQQLKDYILDANFPQDFIGGILRQGEDQHIFLKTLFKFFKTVYAKNPDTAAPIILELLQKFFDIPKNAVTLLKNNMLTTAGFQRDLAIITQVHADGRKEVLRDVLLKLRNNTEKQKATKIRFLKTALYYDGDLYRFFEVPRGLGNTDQSSGTWGVLKQELERLQSTIVITYNDVTRRYTLEQKEEAYKFICDIFNVDDRIRLLKEALQTGTALNDFFILQRGLTPTTEFSGTWYRLKVALRAAQREKFSQDSQQKLQDWRQKYNERRDFAADIIAQIKTDRVLQTLILDKNLQLKEHMEFLQQLVQDSDGEAISNQVLELLQKTFAARIEERVFQNFDVADIFVSFLPEAFLWYCNCLMTLINKREGDVDFFAAVIALLTCADSSHPERASFIARTFSIYQKLMGGNVQQQAYSGDHLIIAAADHIAGIDNILKRYVSFIAELFANMPKEYREQDKIKQSFKNLWSVECVDIFRHVWMFDDSLFKLLENDFFIYIDRPGDIGALLAFDELYKSNLVDNLFSAVDKLESDEGRVALLERALNPETDLGAAFWFQQGIGPCNLRSGSLKEIVAKLAQIQRRSVEEVTKNLEAKYGDHRLLIPLIKPLLDYVGSLFAGSSTHKVAAGPVEYANPLFDPNAMDDSESISIQKLTS